MFCEVTANYIFALVKQQGVNFLQDFSKFCTLLNQEFIKENCIFL